MGEDDWRELWKNETPAQWEDTCEAVERFVFHKVYDHVFGVLEVEQDRAVEERIKSLLGESSQVVRRRIVRRPLGVTRRGPTQIPRTGSRASPMVSARNESWSK